MPSQLVHADYHLLIEKKHIHSKNFNKIQIQPSSIDLTLSEECYEIRASFLSSSSNIRENLKDIMINKAIYPYQQSMNKLFLAEIANPRVDRMMTRQLINIKTGK